MQVEDVIRPLDETSHAIQFNRDLMRATLSIFRRRQRGRDDLRLRRGTSATSTCSIIAGLISVG